jgi:hypothetical protein
MTLRAKHRKTVANTVTEANRNGVENGATAEQLEQERDKRTGRFVAGNRAASRARGTPKTERVTKQERIRRHAVEIAQGMVEDLLPALVRKVQERAEEGDLAAIQTLLKHGLATATPRTVIKGAEDLAALSAEDRIRHINRRMIAGEVPVEHGKHLLEAAKAELEAEAVMPIKRFLADLKSGMTSDEALRRLAQMADQIAVIEHDDVAEASQVVD